MSENKYGKYIKEPVFRKTEYGQEMIFRGKDHDAADACIYWHSISKPAVIEEPAETRDYNRFGILLGGDPKKIPEFTAEAEICLGKEEETQVVDSTSVIHTSPGLLSRNINFRKVDSPVAFMNIYVPAKKK